MTNEKKGNQTKDSTAKTTKLNNQNKKILIIVAAVVGGLIVLSIIGSILTGVVFKKAGTKVVEKAFENTTGSKLNIGKDGKEVTVKGKDGESTFSAGNKKLPDNFPKFIKLYPKAKLITSSSFNASDEGEFFSATFKTNDSSDEVFKFYKSEISKANGYEVVLSQQTDTLSMMQSKHRAEGRTVGVTVMADKEEGGSTIQISSGRLKN